MVKIPKEVRIIFVHQTKGPQEAYTLQLRAGDLFPKEQKPLEEQFKDLMAAVDDIKKRGIEGENISPNRYIVGVIETNLLCLCYEAKCHSSELFVYLKRGL